MNIRLHVRATDLDRLQFHPEFVQLRLGTHTGNDLSITSEFLFLCE